MPTTNGMGHAHVATCFPYGIPVRGTLTFDVRVLMHDNPGTFYRLRPHVQTASGQFIFNEQLPNWTPGVTDATRWFRVTVDTTMLPDGYQELRLFTQVKQPDGKEQHGSTGWQLEVDNGNPERHYRSQGHEFTEGRGWYTGTEYTVARFSSIIPTQPLSGTWTFDVDLKEGAGGTPVTSHLVTVDPDFHAGNEGTVIRHGSGRYIGPISIDTTTLSPGLHRLVLIADSRISTGTNSGVVVIAFSVGD